MINGMFFCGDFHAREDRLGQSDLNPADSKSRFVTRIISEINHVVRQWKIGNHIGVSE